MSNIFLKFIFSDISKPFPHNIMISSEQHLVQNIHRLECKRQLVEKYIEHANYRAAERLIRLGIGQAVSEPNLDAKNEFETLALTLEKLQGKTAEERGWLVKFLYQTQDIRYLDKLQNTFKQEAEWYEYLRDIQDQLKANHHDDPGFKEIFKKVNSLLGQ